MRFLQVSGKAELQEGALPTLDQTSPVAPIQQPVSQQPAREAVQASAQTGEDLVATTAQTQATAVANKPQKQEATEGRTDNGPSKSAADEDSSQGKKEYESRTHCGGTAESAAKTPGPVSTDAQPDALVNLLTQHPPRLYEVETTVSAVEAPLHLPHIAAEQCNLFIDA